MDMQSCRSGHRPLSFSTRLVALAATGALVQTAVAQTPAEGDRDEVIPDVIITATRHATALQLTPLAITAVTSEALVERSITTTAELASIVPNATFRPAQGAFGKGVTAFIRGIGQGDTNLASEPGVAYYIDDVYYPLIFGSMFDLVDLDHVEVLRGPQGTLFGRNALAGAINLVSKEPDFEKQSAYAQITTGRYDRMDIRGGINLPFGERFAVRLSGASKRRTGYQQRLDFRCEMIRRGTPQLAGNFPFSEGLLFDTANFTPEDCVIGHQGGEDISAMRGQAVFRIQPNVKLSVTGDWMQDESENVADQLVAVNATLANNNANLRAIAAQYGPGFAYDSRFVTGSPYSTYATYGDPVPAGTVVPGSSFYNGSVLRGGLRYRAVSPTENWGVSSKLVWGITDTMDLTVVGGYRKYDTVFSFDVDGSPLAMENTRNNTGESHTSGEVRLSGSSNLLDWVGGLFYYRGHGYVHTTLVSPYNNIQRYQNNLYEPVSKAAFVNLTIRPLQKLAVTLGGRYSDDEKPVRYSNLADQAPINNIIFNVTPEDQRSDWKAGVRYNFSDDMMVYTSAATGFRLPSFNSRPLQPSQVTQIPGDEILSYELGIKTDLLDRKLRVNADVFYTDYKTRPSGVSGQEYRIGPNGQPDPGNQVLEALPGVPGATRCRDRTAAEAGSPGFTCIGRTFYVNTPGEVKGVEAEIEARPFDRFSIGASVGYSDFSSPDIDAPARVNKRLLGIPYWTGSAGMQYEAPVSWLQGTITPRLDAFYTGSIAYSASSKTYNQPSYTVVNARFTYSNEERDITLAAGVTNLFDKFYYRNFFIYQELGFPNVEAQPSPPREWFVTIGKRF